jgi:hypothetical protein
LVIFLTWDVVLFIWIYDIIFFLIQDEAKIALLNFFKIYYEKKGIDKGFTGQVLTDSFLIFATGEHANGRKRSIVTKRSISAAHEMLGNRH